MSQELILDEAHLRVLVPAPRRLSAMDILLIVLGVDILIALVHLVDGGSIERYVGAALVVTLIVPAIFALYRLLFPPEPDGVALALDENRVLAPSRWGMKYLNWADVRAVGYVHSISPGSAATLRIFYELLVFERNGQVPKLVLPNLAARDRDTLQAILYRIADRHGFELVFDGTDAGRKRIDELRNGRF